MIKELIQFTNSLDSELKTIGVAPKEGLHIMLNFEEENNVLSISNTFRYELYSKKEKEISGSKRHFASLAQASWMVNTNKCFDLPAKGIHSCSPYCLAFKRESIRGGAKFNDAKIKLYDRVNAYFDKALDLLDDNTEKERVEVFRDLLNTEEKMNFYLDSIEEFGSMKDGEYIIFYLDIPIEKYKIPNNKYLGEKLFNTEEYNVTGEGGMTYGTSNFFNGFNSKKPYLMHQSATFDITGRISSEEAKTLFEFENIAGRRVLPNPLPIFVYEEERIESIALYKEDALESGLRRGYKEIIEDLKKRLNKELGNYYLLFYQNGEIRDFDFISKFDYDLKDDKGGSWEVEDVFEGKYTYKLPSVFEFERLVLPIIFNNALIVRTKTESVLFKYFDDIDAQYCKTANTYLSVMTYRKALYDYIYKSNRTGFTQKAFADLVLTSILDDIRLDKFENNRHSEDVNIRQKLNILFSLYHNFQPFKQDKRFMANQIIELRQFVDEVAEERSSIVNDEEFAFLAGQVIYYILTKSKSDDKSYSKLEPFLQLADGERLKQNIIKIFNSYKHERFSQRFSNPFAQVLTYDVEGNLKDHMPLILAGFFSKNQLFSKPKEGSPLQSEELEF